MKDFLLKVSSGQSGHWGVVDLVHAPSSIEHLLQELRIISKVTGAEPRAVRITRSGVEEAIEKYSRYHDEALEDQQACFCCVVEKFEMLDLDSQFKFLCHTRKLREESTGMQVQTVIHGCWNQLSILEKWSQHREVSPVLNSNNIYRSEGLSTDNLLEILTNEGLVIRDHDLMQRRAAKALREFSGGDIFLVREVLGNLRAHRRRVEAFQGTLEDVIISGSVIDHMALRLQVLSPDGCDILANVLNSQPYKVGGRDPVVEQLRLLGLIVLERIETETFASIPSPLMNAVLRQNWSLLSSTPTREVCASGDLQWPLRSISSLAYQQVMEIECLLRNWLVSGLGAQGRDWREALASITFWQEGHGQSEVLAVGERQLEMQRSQLKVKLSGQGVLSFIPPEALSAILTQDHGEIRNLVATAFPKVDDARVFITSFNDIRSAVVRNLNLSFSCLSDLANLRKELVLRLGGMQ